MRRALLCLLGALVLAPVTASAATPASVPKFERHGAIERFRIASRHTGRTYTIEIFRPAGYESSQANYPALFLLDGDYAFDPAVAISSYMQRGEINPHLIIGINNDVPFGASLAERRTPDFTPPMASGVMRRDAPSPYYLFLRDELLPAVQARVRVDSAQTTLWGYSLSGSFVTWLNDYDPALFRNYVLASPNWGDFGIQQRLMQGGVFNAPKLDVKKLFISFDKGSEIPPELEAPFKAYLGGTLPGYKAKYLLTQGESHTSSWFVALPSALRYIYGKE